MIDQNTVVSVRYGSGGEINLGRISVFSYPAPLSDGRINLSFCREGRLFDREDVTELMMRTQSAVELIFITDEKHVIYPVRLDEVKLQTGKDRELLELKSVRL